MIVSRTPLRMSFVGGGSDLPNFYRRFGGAVLSTAIDRYIYVNVNRKFDDGIRIAYSRTEEVERVSAIEHRLVRAVLEMLDIGGGVEITTIADIPARGTGLGSSSAFTAGLINAMTAYLGRHISAQTLGRLSCDVEIERCSEPIGKQDQYASAVGGMNLIIFNPDESVELKPVIMPRALRQQLADGILIFYTGVTRSASAVLRAQSEAVDADRAKQQALQRMVELAHILHDELGAGRLDSFGEILHENWLLKKSLSPHVSTPFIEDWYDGARASGALGGKLLGAGAGGFLMFYAPPERHDAIAAALPGLRRMKFGLEPLGSRIIFYDPVTGPC